MLGLQPIARSGKLLKPKAEDPYKRDMTAEEKQKLWSVLQELPSEKLNQMIQIVKKRTSNLLHEGDEIEVDIETLDNETLWELDRFVGYHQKSISKFQTQMIFQEMAPAEQIVAKHLPKDEPMEIEGQQLKKGDAVGEEEVDIGEEIPVNNFPPVEIERGMLLVQVMTRAILVVIPPLSVIQIPRVLLVVILTKIVYSRLLL